MKWMVLGCCVLVGACATTSETAKEVHIIDSKKAASCVSMGSIRAQAAAGIPTYQEKAMADVRNQAALLGADSIQVNSSRKDDLLGWVIDAEALRCEGKN